MGASGHRRQILLFLVALLLPVSVLILLTWQMIRQQRELADTRWEEQTRLVGLEIGQRLLIELDEITAGQIRELQVARAEGRSPSAIPPVAYLAEVRGNQLRAQWEASLEDESEAGREGVFQQWINQGERLEFVQGRLGEAARSFRQARRRARSPSEEAYATLLQARALAKTDEIEQARTLYLELLNTSPSVRDRNGVAFSFFAAERLATLGWDLPAAFSVSRAQLNRRLELTPIETHLVRSIVDTCTVNFQGSQKAEAEATLRELDAHIANLNTGRQLAQDFPTLRGLRGPPLSDSEGPVWTHYRDRWMVNIAAARWLVAVDSEPLIRKVSAEFPTLAQQRWELKLVSDAGAGRVPLGVNFSNVGLAITRPELAISSGVGAVPGAYYILTLVLVLGITLLGAYLLWRDVRRELKVADLRAQFVSSVSHELKTPLTSIRMFAETLKRRPASRRKRQEEYLDTIIGESERLTRLLDNILDFSKIEQGIRSFPKKPAPLHEILETAAHTMRYVLAQRDVELNYQAEELPDIAVDRDAIEQAVLNLLSNAVKYSPKGSSIDLGLAGENGCAVIAVRDRGVGIEPEEHKRIFEKYYRVKSADNRNIPGTGLGLALVDHIARAHGGTVAVDSSPGEGSTFSILLPMEGQS